MTMRRPPRSAVILLSIIAILACLAMFHDREPSKELDKPPPIAPSLVAATTEPDAPKQTEHPRSLSFAELNLEPAEPPIEKPTDSEWTALRAELSAAISRQDHASVDTNLGRIGTWIVDRGRGPFVWGVMTHSTEGIMEIREACAFAVRRSRDSAWSTKLEAISTDATYPPEVRFASLLASSEQERTDSPSPRTVRLPYLETTLPKPLREATINTVVRLVSGLGTEPVKPFGANPHQTFHRMLVPIMGWVIEDRPELGSELAELVLEAARKKPSLGFLAGAFAGTAWQGDLFLRALADTSGAARRNLIESLGTNLARSEVDRLYQFWREAKPGDDMTRGTALAALIANRALSPDQAIETFRSGSVVEQTLTLQAIEKQQSKEMVRALVLSATTAPEVRSKWVLQSMKSKEFAQSIPLEDATRLVNGPAEIKLSGGALMSFVPALVNAGRKDCLPAIESLTQRTDITWPPTQRELLIQNLERLRSM